MRGLPALIVSQILGCALVFPQAANDKQVPGAIKVRVLEVPVEVWVTDPHGDPVLDLERSDFQVFDNRTPQTLTHFSRRAGTPAEVGAPDADRRNYLILVGRGRHFDDENSMRELISFVETGLRPEDKVGVQVFNLASDLGADRAPICEILRRYQRIGPELERMINAHTTGLQTIFRRHSLGEASRAILAPLFADVGVGVRTVLPIPVEDTIEVRKRLLTPFQKTEAYMRREAWELNNLQRISELGSVGLVGARGPNIFDTMKLRMLTDLSTEQYYSLVGRASTDLENLYAAIEYLRFIPGERHIIFLTGHGLVLYRDQDYIALARQASDAQVRIHSIQTSGVYVQDSGRTSFTMSGALEDVRRMANLTGGLAAAHEAISQACGRILEVSRARYLLAYAPVNAKADGKFHRIDVKVRRPGLRVYARSGYFSGSTLAPYDHQEFLAYARTWAAARYDQIVRDIGVDLGQIRVESTAKKATRLWVTVLFTVTPDVFRSMEGRRYARFRIVYFAAPENGRAVATANDTLELRLSEATYKRSLTDGVTVSAYVDVARALKSGYLKAIVYDERNDRLGSAVKRFP